MGIGRDSRKSEDQIVDDLRSIVVPFDSDAESDLLMNQIRDQRIVMLGEASHGTHEYYLWRAAFSQRLITEKGFNLIAVEGDWPDVYDINRFIKGYPGSGENIRTVLDSFRRWPSWMWANYEIAAFAEWLRNHNQAGENPVGFYGFDVYSLWESIDSIREFLKQKYPEQLPVAESVFSCFEPYRYDEGQSYARATSRFSALCEDEVIALLANMHKVEELYRDDPETAFSNIQNAHIAVNAEKYYRSMFGGGNEAWNIRDQHMMDTINRLLEFGGPDSKIIVWAHNTHIGDARATDMAAEGMHNVGQLAREEYGDEVFLVGLGSYTGTVVAGSSWGAKAEVMQVPPAKEKSIESRLHQAGISKGMFLTKDYKEKQLPENVNHRAIGVVYQPEYEQFGNYVPSMLASRYDAFVYFDATRALYPVHQEIPENIIPDTYPFGI